MSDTQIWYYSSPFSEYLQSRIAEVELMDFFRLSYPIEGRPGYYRSGFKDLLPIFLCALVLLVVRSVAFKFVITPFLKMVGIKKQRTLVKGCEAGWFFLYYLPVFSTGLYLVISNGWFEWPLASLWEQYPFRDLTQGIKIYMIFQVGFYLQAMIVLLVEDKRKDFPAMMLHHIVTAYLIGAALLWNYTYYGIIVVMLHDFADIFLYMTKVIHYAKHKSQDAFFAIFALSFLVSRLIIFPGVVWSYWTISPDIMKHGMAIIEEEGYYVHNTVRASVPLFGVLLCLHLYWFYLIINMVADAIQAGELEKDIRSDDEKDD